MKLVIIAGGGGTRLFPLSRLEYPKQFINIDSDMSLFAQTIDRYGNFVNIKDIVIVTSEKYNSFVKEELIKCKAEGANVVLEPMQRNTLPAIGLAVRFIIDELKCTNNEDIFVAPADHIVHPKEGFAIKVKKCMEASREGKIVTLGIAPVKLDNGYGYIKCGQVWKEGFEVEKFIEKPDRESAQKYIEEGGYYWNSGMYCFSIKTFMDELKTFEPEMYDIFSHKNYFEILDCFKEIKSISIDYAIAEKSLRVVIIPLDVYWNDVGSWDSIYDYMGKDKNGNVKNGDYEIIECKNSLIMSNNRLVAAIGLENIIVAETEDVILILKRGESQRVKELVERLKERPEVKKYITSFEKLLAE